jgi:sugar (pentulose or hexulose) kinase
VVNRLFLCLDAGSEGGRVVLMTERGTTIAASRRSWPVDHMNCSLVRELDAEAMWSDFLAMIREVLAARDSRDEVTAISVTSQRQGVFFLDADSEVLYAGPNNDLRAVFEGAALQETYGDLLYDVTGHAPPFLFSAARLLWFKANEPAVHSRIRHLLMIADWLIFRLTGEAVSEASLAAEAGLFDIMSRDWSTSLIRELEIDPALLPPIVPAGTHVGHLRSALCAELGLPGGVSVVVAGADTQCAMLSMGVSEPGMTGAVLGWSGPVQMALAHAMKDTERRIWTTCHVVPDRWLLESTVSEAGNAYRWLRDTLYVPLESGLSCPPEYTSMDRLASETDAGASGVLAFLGPGIMDMRTLRMQLGGFLFSLPTTFSGVDQGCFIRAALENIAFAVKGNVLQLVAVGAITPDALSLGGGMSCSTILVQILSDVLDMPVRTFCSENLTALGAGICAATGAAIYPDLESATRAMAPKASETEPQREYVPEYEELYGRWLNAYRQLERMNGEV